jgi:hypothetical protein
MHMNSLLGITSGLRKEGKGPFLSHGLTKSKLLRDLFALSIEERSIRFISFMKHTIGSFQTDDQFDLFVGKTIVKQTQNSGRTGIARAISVKPVKGIDSGTLTNYELSMRKQSDAAGTGRQRKNMRPARKIGDFDVFSKLSESDLISYCSALRLEASTLLSKINSECAKLAVPLSEEVDHNTFATSSALEFLSFLKSFNISGRTERLLSKAIAVFSELDITYQAAVREFEAMEPVKAQTYTGTYLGNQFSASSQWVMDRDGVDPRTPSFMDADSIPVRCFSTCTSLVLSCAMQNCAGVSAAAACVFAGLGRHYISTRACDRIRPHPSDSLGRRDFDVRHLSQVCTCRQGHQLVSNCRRHWRYP